MSEGFFGEEWKNRSVLMHFRPLPILTICSLAVLGLLLWLGQWQWQRADWKRNLIAEYALQIQKGESHLSDAFCGDAEKTIGLRVLPSNAVSTEWLRVYGQSTAGRPGWRIYTAIESPDCIEGALLAESAFEDYNGRVELIDTLRIASMKDHKTNFSNKNNPDKNEWYWFDVNAMENAFFLENTETNSNTLNRDFILLPGNGLPADLTLTPPERHIGYSVTWFGMAIALIVIYAAFHIGAGRLRFSKTRK